MKRLTFSVVMLLCVAAIVGTLAVSASAPNQSEPAATTTPQIPIRYGYGGKISAIKPPGDWTQSGGPPDTHPVLALFSALNMPTFGVDKNIAGGNEVVIASNPTNPLNFLAGANNTGRFTTTDGGVTWSVGSLAGGGDPVTAFDSTGRAYFALLGNTSSCPDNPYFYSSTDGGFTFTGPVLPITDPVPGEHFFDKEWMAVDNNPTSPYFGRIYYTVTNFHTPPGCNLNNYIDNKIQLVYSTNQGTTWSAPTLINDASHDQNQFTHPVAARDGTLYVGYQYQNCTFNCTSSIPMVNLIAKSSDGGISFSPSITITGQPIVSTGAFVGGYQYLYAGSTTSGFRHNDQAIIGVSPTNPNEVYAVWTDGRWDTSFVYQTVTGQHGDIASSRSTDGGNTWSTPIRVNDDAMANGKDQFFPWMVVGTDGVIHASWSDRRDSPSGFQFRAYYSQSTDGGLTWATNIPVADVGGTPGTFIGDYSGLAVNYDNTLVLPIWTDSRSGTRAYIDRGILAQGTPTITPQPSATCVPAGGMQDVGITDFAFTPQNLNIPQGTTVRWTNNDVEAHTSTSDTAVWDSGSLSKGDQFSFTFNTPGTYPYHCAIHPTMLGTITVQAAVPCATSTIVLPTSTATRTNTAVAPTNTSVASTSTSTRTSTTVPVATSTTAPTSSPSATVCIPGTCQFVLGVTDTGNHCNDCVTQITLPFPFTFYDQTFTTANVSSNGNLQFASSNPAAANVCLPASGFSYAIMPHWDDLRTDTGNTGIYTSISGTAPNRIFNIEWFTSNVLGTGEATFEVRLHEGQTRVQMVYGYTTHDGNSATIGVQKDTTTFTHYSCNIGLLHDGLCFTLPPTPLCPTATPLPTSTPCPITFTDVDPDNTFYAFIRCLACRGIISGYGDGTFRPNNDISRGQIAKMVSNSAGFGEDPGSQIYEDVPPASPFYSWINRLSMRGHMGGYNCGIVPEEPCGLENRPYFRPSASATRGQLAKIVSNAAGLSGTPSGIFYTDVQEDNPFYVWIMRLTTLNVMSGYTCGGPNEPCDESNRPYFRPFATVTRGQASKIVANTFFPGCQTPR